MHVFPALKYPIGGLCASPTRVNFDEYQLAKFGLHRVHMK